VEEPYAPVSPSLIPLSAIVLVFRRMCRLVVWRLIELCWVLEVLSRGCGMWKSIWRVKRAESSLLLSSVTDHGLHRQFICRATPVIPLGLGDPNW